MSEIFEAADEIFEEVFPPKPGGMVDRHRKRKAAELAAQQEAEDAAEPVEQSSYRAVKVAPEAPEVFNAITYTIAPGAYAMILPNAPFRVRAIVRIIPVQAVSSSIILAKDSGSALGGAGYSIQSIATASGFFGDAPLELHHRGQLYAANNSATTVQISVLSESYKPELCRP